MYQRINETMVNINISWFGEIILMIPKSLSSKKRSILNERPIIFVYIQIYYWWCVNEIWNYLPAPVISNIDNVCVYGFSFQTHTHPRTHIQNYLSNLIQFLSLFNWFFFVCFIIIIRKFSNWNLHYYGKNHFKINWIRFG